MAVPTNITSIVKGASKPSQVGFERQEIEKIPEIEELAAVSCAVQNMHLTASALGMFRSSLRQSRNR